MKRFVSLVLVVLLLGSSSAFADIDLSGMSYDELLALKEQINLAMWKCEEWQEVTVPQGVYLIGKDIPSGEWTILPPTGAYCFITIGDKLNNSGTAIDLSLDGGEIRETVSVYSETYGDFKSGENMTSVNMTLPEGLYIQIRYNSCIFTPYQGQPSLGFK